MYNIRTDAFDMMDVVTIRRDNVSYWQKHKPNMKLEKALRKYKLPLGRHLEFCYKA